MSMAEIDISPDVNAKGIIQLRLWGETYATSRPICLLVFT